MYVRGKRDGPGKIVNRDGSLSYEGEFKGGLPNGHGKGFKDGILVHEGKFI
jgi:antitoxin component YwqK of YwqJK toxin-antitoxin module